MTKHNPEHIGIIIDGNRRWACQHGKKSITGHKAGYKALSRVIKHTRNKGVSYITVYVFSSENWKRSEEEVSGLMKLVRYVFANELESFVGEDLRLRVIGSRTELPKDIVKSIEAAEASTVNNKNGTLVLCFNYGGQQEIAYAANKASQSGKQAITTEDIEDNLYAPDIPPVDLIIRTGGEKRISNFMLWRAAYSELYFSDKYWPDFGPEDLDRALEEYSERQRRFGK